MSPRVLLVSRDAMLLHTRQLILGAFFSVQGIGRVREAEEWISSRLYDLIILCYTLTREECRQMIDLAAGQKRPARVLVLAPNGMQTTDPGAGNATMSEAGPYHLLKKSAEMLGVDLRATTNLVGI